MEFNTELVNQSKNGDTKAFGELYSMVYKDLYKYAYYVLKNEEDAKDVVGETVLDAFNGIKGLNNPNAFGGWIFRILYSKCKRKLWEYTSNTVEFVEGQYDKTNEIELSIDLKNVFVKLEPLDREIVSMKVFMEYNSKEIAEILNMNAGTVRTRLKRALDYMKQML